MALPLDWDRHYPIVDSKDSSSRRLYSFALDFDGIDAVLEWFRSWERVTELSKKTQ